MEGSRLLDVGLDVLWLASLPVFLCLRLLKQSDQLLFTPGKPFPLPWKTVSLQLQAKVTLLPLRGFLSGIWSHSENDNNLASQCGLCVFFPWVSLSLSLSLTHTHTHTHTQGERERERILEFYFDKFLLPCTISLQYLAPLFPSLVPFPPFPTPWPTFILSCFHASWPRYVPEHSENPSLHLNWVFEWSKSNPSSKMSGEGWEGVSVFLNWFCLSDNRGVVIVFRN